MELRKKHEPKSIIDKTIKALDFEEEKEFTEVFYWRKDYNLHDFIGEMFGGIENCKEYKLDKEKIENLLSYLKDTNGEIDLNFKDEIYEYDTEIETLKEIIKNYDDEEYIYYYWAWW